MCNVTRENMSQSEFRFAVICIWYAMFRKTNGRMEVFHYPVNKQTHHRRSLAMTVTSPRKGAHNIQRISSEDSSIKDQRLKCPICGKKTSFKCSKCSSPGDPLVICCPSTGRQCLFNIISLQNMTYQVANPRRKHKDYRLFYSLNNF